MLDELGGIDDEIAMKYLEGEAISTDEINAAIRKGTLDLSIVPIISGSSFKNKGVQAMIDAIVEFLPSPTDVGGVKGVNPRTEEIPSSGCPTDEEPFSALAFKIMSDKYVGRLTFLRVYSGVLKKGTPITVAYRDPMTNEFRTRTERIGRILEMHANSRNDIDEVYAGEIVGVIGLNDVNTGYSVCDNDKQIALESIKFPEPVIQIAIEPKSRADQEKLGTSLQRLAQEDPTFRVFTDHESGQTIISGMGELHLEIIVDRLNREFGVQANQGKPQVAYRETVRSKAKGEGRYIRQTGGSGQYGHCWVEMEPLPAGSGFVWENKTVGGSIPKEYIPACEKGVREGLISGVLAGYPVVDIKVSLTEGLVPRGRLERERVQAGGPDGVQGGDGEGRPLAQGADHARRGHDARGQRGRRRGRHELATRPHRGHGARDGRGDDRERARPALGDVRLRDDAAVAYPGPRPAERDPLALRGGPEQHRDRDQGEGRWRSVKFAVQSSKRPSSGRTGVSLPLREQEERASRQRIYEGIALSRGARRRLHGLGPRRSDRFARRFELDAPNEQHGDHEDGLGASGGEERHDHGR